MTTFVPRNMRQMLHKKRALWSKVFGKLNPFLEIHIYKSIILRPLRSVINTCIFVIVLAIV